MHHRCADVVIPDSSSPGLPPANTTMTKRISPSEDSQLEPLKRPAGHFIHCAPSMRAFSTARVRLRRLAVLWVLFGVTVMAVGQESVQPLKPLDRSSPRAALKTFLDSGDNLGAFLANEYLESPSRAKFHQGIVQTDVLLSGLNLSEVPLAARERTGRAAAVALYGALNRIPLPPWEAIPDGAEFAAKGTNTTRWVIPDTEIVLERTTDLIGEGKFLFSPETVARAGEFHEKVKGLPYQRAVPLENLSWVLAAGGGWMIPYSWVRGLPDWLQQPIGGQAPWKWIGLLLILGVVALLMRWVYRLSRWRNKERPFLEALAQFTLPATILVLTPIVFYLTRVQLKLVGSIAVGTEVVGTALMFLAGAWLVWRAAPVLAEAVISSPSIRRESIDAHLIRIFTRLLGLVLAIALLVVGSDLLGVHAYGIIAGLGVGGLAIALAAQPTVENLIGGLSLFADRPVRVGDFCKYGDDVGTIEAIGIRSTRIRGIDRTVTTIPNGVFSKMPVVNLTLRDRMLLKTVISLRYETTPEQLRHVVAKLRELLLAHPMVTPEPSRVRFAGFDKCSLNVEVFAYVGTKDWNEFLGVQEDIYLRMIDVVAASGTRFALPSQTLYFARDEGLDADKSAASVAEVQQWRAAQKLPFPDFDIEFRKTHRDTLDYPPNGSSTAEPKKQS
jgi:MscS family membrane protein